MLHGAAAAVNARSRSSPCAAIDDSRASMRSSTMVPVRSLTLCGLLLHGACALAGRLEFPLRVPLEPIRQALGAQLAASPARPNVIYREGRCRYLSFETPKLEALDGRLRLSGPASAALGVELF